MFEVETDGNLDGIEVSSNSLIFSQGENRLTYIGTSTFQCVKVGSVLQEVPLLQIGAGISCGLGALPPCAGSFVFLLGLAGLRF